MFTAGGAACLNRDREVGERQLTAHIIESFVSPLGGLLIIAFDVHGWWCGVPE